MIGAYLGRSVKNMRVVVWGSELVRYQLQNLALLLYQLQNLECQELSRFSLWRRMVRYFFWHFWLSVVKSFSDKSSKVVLTWNPREGILLIWKNEQ
jgi:hypothetical protein